MGMAASQARFLQLTARKSNIEYMGQQLNQERIALANQSAGLFERMLTLDPPTPPSSLDDKYYTQGYMFEDGIDQIDKKISWQTMDEVIATGVLGDGTAITGASAALSFEYTAYADGAIAESDAPSGSTADDAGDILWVDSADTTVVAESGGGGLPAVAGFSSTTGTVDLSYQDFADMDTQEEVDAFMTSVGMSKTEGATNQVIRFVTIEHNAYDPDGEYITIQQQTPALLEFDDLERLVNVVLLNEVQASQDFGSAGSIELAQGTGGGSALQGAASGGITDGVTNTANTENYATYTAGSNGVVPADFAAYTASPSNISLAGVEDASIGTGEALTYSGVFDEDMFNDDMNKYEFNKSAYDYQIERINLQTAKIQKQDKSLELKMKQIDTEHRAIQTELEAVQKVIQKNIEQSFKTFA